MYRKHRTQWKNWFVLLCCLLLFSSVAYAEEGDAKLLGWQNIDGRWYHFEETTGEQLIGFQEKTEGEDIGWYYYEEDGSLLPEGWHVVNGSLRYVQGNGCFATGWKTNEAGERYYLGASGYAYKGWNQIDGRWYSLDNSTGVQNTGWQYRTENGVRYQYYYYPETGELMAAGWGALNGYTRYVDADGTMHQGWLEDGGKKYYTGGSGIPLTGKQEIKGGKYWFDNHGILLEDLLGWQNIDGRWYHFEETTGEQLIGFQEKTEGEDIGWYYYEEDGSLLPEGWHVVNGSLRYVQGNGCFATGWKTNEAGERYYLGASGYAYKGWNQIDGRWYHMDESSGVQLLDFQQKVSGPDSGWYYYQENGELLPEGWATVNGAKRWVEANGRFYAGWKEFEDGRYYFGDSGYLYLGWEIIDGRWYHLDEITGVQLLDFQHKTEGEDTGWYYYQSDGKLLPEGWAFVNGAERWVEANGRFYAGWKTIEGQMYYFGDSGYMYKNGWFTINQKKCYFTEKGYYVAPPTINNVLYTIQNNKAAVTITATSSPNAELASEAYSWDGGKTWTKENVRNYTAGTIILAGTLQVRDAVGNISVYGTDLNLKKDGPYMGIDVSAYQGPIDWAAVKASGVDFAIVRALTWSNSVGYYVIDPYFEYNIRNAKANGIKVGAYLFSYAFNAEEIYEEIDYFHNSAEMKSLRKNDIQFDYPVYIDFEWDKILEKTNYDQRTEMLRLGMIRLEKYGYYPGFYSNNTWATKYYNAKYLVDCGYDFWYARYPANPDLSAGTKPLLGFEAQMWQYASDGRVNGINGNVDMNICYVDYESIIGAGGSSGGGAQLTLSVYDVNTSRQVTGAVQDILSQIVMNEVGEWSNDEVSKAQAIAAYSWIMYQQQHGNAVPSVGLATPSSAVKRAVSEVAGKALYYNGSVINAAYGSASGPYTNTAKNMWSLELPYLNTPIYSPETSWRGRSNTIKFSTMQENLSKMVGAALVNSTPHSQWIANPVFDNNGYLTSIKVCGQKVSGGTFYENCWGLYSPKFSFTYNADADSWTFVTDGNGHCVGMSQWGAYTYAKTENWNYTQILAHYYPQTTLK